MSAPADKPPAHSPGPWHWDDANYGLLLDASGEPIIELTPVAFGTPSAEDANARLIAAAPEMLALLRRLSTSSFDGENAIFDETGCSMCGGNGYHVGACKLAALLARFPEPPMKGTR